MTQLSTVSWSSKKSITSLLFFIVFGWVLLLVTPNFHSYHELTVRNTTFMYLAGIAFFYIHTLVLIPTKLEGKNNKKYLLLGLICLLAFVWVEIHFFFNVIKRWDDSYYENIVGISPGQMFTAFTLMRMVAPLSVLLLIIAALSLVYSLIVYGFKVISPFLEAFVHLVGLTMLFVLIINVPEIEKRASSLVFPSILLFYTNTFATAPILLRDKKKKDYLLWLSVFVIGYFILQAGLLINIGLPIFNPETGDRYDHFTALKETVFDIPSIIALLITFSLSFIYSNARIKSRAKEAFLTIKLGKKESELKLLKSQVNPHFLFNALNTLYATALTEKAEKTGESIAKLANLLRYMQKDINIEFIPLANEVKYVQDYIAIQKLRCAVEPQINAEFVNIDDQIISPGLLIPFVENAFKYGIDPSKVSTLTLSVICRNGHIHFSCINNYDDGFKPFHKEQGLGIGIKNAKQRLELVYPKKHTFEINKKDNQFSVKITIPDLPKN
ncbi:histidine kinase [Flammeovirgaceae bacterium SG7u.111]|nr:histidine kinase [Flammeovirgaceae bacterium SG7u.132]WPO37843.1 histidine kinase [Flammeovirgaceae bacterium SG7u.111]